VNVARSPSTLELDFFLGLPQPFESNFKTCPAIVTGGTKGIGKAICESLAAEGVDIALCSRKQEEVDAMVTSLQSEFGIKAYGAALDVADGEALKAWVTSMGEKLGGIDVVVSNVSALNGGDDEAIYKACYELDLMGAVRMRQAAMPFFEKSANPSFIAISSVSGLETDGFFEGYGCMKGGTSSSFIPPDSI
jgi:3-oxoacyl-[acyl-carrier protein] reductase